MIDTDKEPRQDLGLCSFSFERYSEKCFTHIYRAFYGNPRRGTNMAAVK